MTRLVLVDIEGTVSSITFVKDVLFPYARQRLAAYLSEHDQNPQTVDVCRQVEEICGRKMTQAEIVETLTQWIDEDRKVTPLKALQGYIWEEGFKSGAFKAHMYPDAVDKLKAWKQQGLTLCVYSSGSVFAQKLFFGHTEYGDLTNLFSGFFDTTIGGKKEKESYEKIAAQTGFESGSIFFLSDIEAELDAAAAAGFKTAHIDREKNIAESRHRIYTDFNTIEIRG